MSCPNELLIQMIDDIVCDDIASFDIVNLSLCNKRLYNVGRDAAEKHNEYVSALSRTHFHHLPYPASLGKFALGVW